MRHRVCVRDEYKQLRNKVTSATDKAKQEYYQTLLAENMHKPDALWKAIKKVLPQRKREKTVLLCDENGEHTTPKAIANSFNTFFANIGAKLASAFPVDVQITNPYPDVNATFKFVPIQLNFTLKQLKLLSAGKSTGLDNINARLLKDAAEVVAGPITAIMNASLHTGEIPNMWKKSRVTPIYKAEDPQNPSNYRPIAILPVSMKIFERAVHIQLNSYLKKIGVMCEEQSGFREGHSTATAVTNVTDFILDNMNNGKLAGGVFLDLKKAFDTVDAQTLLFKLQCLGINNTELAWFKNYLIDRSQCVAFSGATSDECNLSCGVPQGSILGPLLFVTFINDITQSISECKIVLYADDTIILFASNNPDIIKEKLEQDLMNANRWLKSNKLNLNISKCKWMMFGTARKLRHAKATDISIGDVPLEKVQTYKYLGMWMDSQLNWHHHLDKMRAKISQRLGVLRRVRSFLTEDITKNLFNAMVMPLFDYCDVIYAKTDNTSLNKLQRLHNRGGKLILRVGKDTATTDVQAQLRWIPLAKRVIYHTNILTYKCLTGLAPEYLSRYFKYVDHPYQTRYREQHMLYVPKPKTELMKRAFRYNGAINWNLIPITCKNAETLNSFKSMVLKHISTT